MGKNVLISWEFLLKVRELLNLIAGDDLSKREQQLCDELSEILDSKADSMERREEWQAKRRE
jgi:hypothetical protein